MLRLTVLLIVFFITLPAYAGADSGLAINTASCSFSEWVNTCPDNKPIEESVERIVLREQWEKNLGIDVFYPYFKVKELESKVRQKTSVRVFKIRGKSELKSNEAKYTFSVKF